MISGLNWLKHQAKAFVGTVGVALVALAGVVDYLSVPQLVFSFLYLLPVLLVAGFVGRRAGIISAIVCAGVSLAMDLLEPTKYSVAFIPYWNALIQLAVFVTTALLASALRALTDELEDRVERRTADLRAEASAHQMTATQLRASEEHFRQVTEAITEVFWMTNVEKTEMVYISPGYEKIWGRTCQSLCDAPQTWLESIHPEDRQRVLRASLSTQVTGCYDEEFRILRSDGSIRWIRDRAFPVHDGSGRVCRVAGIAEDITDHKRLQREIIEISERENRRLGQDLHDGVCQNLVALAMTAKLLEQKLQDGVPIEGGEAGRIVTGINRAIAETRALAQGLYPVRLEHEGVADALRDLCGSVQETYHVPCEFACDLPVELPDAAQALELYRIAQEAVHNAVRHAQPTRVSLRLSGGNGQITLRVSDDGVGIPPRASQNGGMGLAIMAYRARLLGATLRIDRQHPHGTCVACVLSVAGKDHHP